MATHPSKWLTFGWRCFALAVPAGLAIGCGPKGAGSQAADLPARLTSGEIRPIDGDSFHLGDVEIRLHAIDAPEGRQRCRDAEGESYRCGERAGDKLMTILVEPGLECRPRNRDRYGRVIATCETDRTPDVGSAMVRGGEAVALTIEGARPYAADESAAEAARRGIWRGPFTRPGEWRERRE